MLYQRITDFLRGLLNLQDEDNIALYKVNCVSKYHNVLYLHLLSVYVAILVCSGRLRFKDKLSQRLLGKRTIRKNRLHGSIIQVDPFQKRPRWVFLHGSMDPFLFGNLIVSFWVASLEKRIHLDPYPIRSLVNVVKLYPYRSRQVRIFSIHVYFSRVIGVLVLLQ